jgi:hypothetical protein
MGGPAERRVAFHETSWVVLNRPRSFSLRVHFISGFHVDSDRLSLQL